MESEDSYTGSERLEMEEETYRGQYTTHFRLFELILPHVFLQLLLVSYLLFGGTVFYYLESANEVMERKQQMANILKIRDHFHSRLWSIRRNPEKKLESSKKQIHLLGQRYFEKLATNIAVAHKRLFLKEQHLLYPSALFEKDEPLVWSFNNSLLYAAAVLTVIGYGGQIPTTTAGRGFSILYVLMGYPILLVVLADIGMIYTSCFKKLCKISNYISFFCSTSNYRHPYSIPLLLLLLKLFCFLCFGAVMVKQWKGCSFFDSFFYCFMATAKIGYDNIGPVGTFSTIVALVYVLVGLSLAVMCIDSAGTVYIHTLHRIELMFSICC